MLKDLGKKGQCPPAQRAATAPIPPKRADTIFDSWDTPFDSITSDLTVRAVYREKETHTVTFLDYTGTVIATKTVKETDTVEAPRNPTRDGYIFTGWSSSLANITSDKTVVAQYRIVSGENIFDISYSLKGNGLVSVTVSVQGNVCLAGIQGEMKLPFGVSEVSVSASGETLANIEGNTLYYTFVSATNVTKSFTLFTVTFKSSASTLAFDLGLGTDDVFDQNGAAVSFKVIGTQVKLR